MRVCEVLCVFMYCLYVLCVCMYLCRSHVGSNFSEFCFVEALHTGVLMHGDDMQPMAPKRTEVCIYMRMYACM